MFVEDNYEILEAIPNPIIVTSQDETIVLVNGLAEELFSCNREQMLGRSVEELVSEGSRDKYRTSFSELLRRPGRVKLSLYALARDGREFPVEVNFTQFAAGKDISILNAFSNCSNGIEYTRAQTLDSDKRYFELFENASDILFTLDLTGKCTSLNKSGEQILGYKIAEAMSMDILQVAPPEHLDTIRAALSKVAAGDILQTVELEVITKDGRRVSLEVSAKAVYKQGEPIGIQGTARDISEKKLLQEQLTQAQKMEAIGRLAGGVAHDFNNILTIIGCYSDLLLGELRPGDPKLEYVKQIQGAGKKGSWLALQLLAFSRKQARSPRVLDINMVVSECTKMLDRIIGKDIQVHTRLSPDIGTIKADPGQIEQVVLNLAVNARDAMPDGGQFVISTYNSELDKTYVASHLGACQGSYVTLEVSDTGQVMDAETQGRVFEPFSTANEERKETGLGLATVYGIVKQNNGYIWLNSQSGQGTKLTIHLPRTQDVICSDRPAESSVTAEVETILLVEDEESVRNILGRILKDSGYNVLIAKNSEEALFLSRTYEQSIHLLITDILIPGMNGRELARAISGWKPATKVLYISGGADDLVAQYGIHDMEAHFLQKPFQRNQLLEKIHSLLDQAC
jgi:two-component system, cell cycle sensor histidine kinase and response regulator CckA